MSGQVAGMVHEERSLKDIIEGLFKEYEEECDKCLANGCVLPAYDMVMKSSHVFNMLDARNAISVTERAGYIARVRELMKKVSSAYISSREAMNYPLIKNK